MRRRFLFYFLLVCALVVAATVAFEIFATRHVLGRSLEQQMLFSRSVAQYLLGVIERESDALTQVLESVPARLPGQEALRERLQAGGEGHLVEELALFDSDMRLIGQVPTPGGLAPPEVLLPALRQAMDSDAPAITDLWLGLDERPRISIVQDHTRDDVYRAVVGQILLDREAFKQLFSYFVLDRESRLDLLDSGGTALFSTVERQSFQSAVHGTYLTDRSRLGEPAQMECHSCHVAEGDTVPTRVAGEAEYVSTVPLAGTGWSVAVRLRETSLFAPARDVASSSIALVGVALAAFIAFFVLVWRRVLGPVGRLAAKASEMSGAAGPSARTPGKQDDVGVLTHSLEVIRRRLGEGPAAGEEVEE